MSKHINFVGLFNSPVSWAKILRNYAYFYSLKRDNVTILPRRGYFYQKDKIIDEKLKSLKLLEKGAVPDVQIAFEYPQNYAYLVAPRKIGLMVYETDVLPDEWVRNINRYLDMLIVPNKFCEKIMLNNGVRVPVRIVPYGVDLNEYSAFSGKQEKHKQLTFLHIALPHKRKATDIVLAAFLDAFRANEDVKLIIKMPGWSKNKLPWEYDIRKEAGLPNDKVAIIAEPYTDRQMSKLYKSADVFLQPSFSEGFGMSILEAFASGIPAVVTGFGAQMEFCNDENSFIIGYKPIAANEIQYDVDTPGNNAVVGRADQDELVSVLRKIYKNPRIAHDKKHAAIKTAEAYTWQTAVDKLIESIEN